MRVTEPIFELLALKAEIKGVYLCLENDNNLLTNNRALAWYYYWSS